ncbi:MAG: Anthranilate synthase [Paenibacillaceae bacterium]|nr:Anthranilate synthase [Paenibacillaceae bacterium]
MRHVKEDNLLTATTLQDWLRWTPAYTMLPYIEAHSLEGIPAQWDGLWSRSGQPAFVLESGKGGRYTIAGCTPASMIEGKGAEAAITDWSGTDLRKELRTGSPLSLIREWMSPFQAPTVPGAPKICGGAVGYLSYDVVRHLEKLPESARDDLGISDYVMLRFEELWVADLQERKLYCCVHTPAQLQAGEEETERLYHKAAERASVLKREWDRLVRAGEEESACRRLARMRDIVSGQDLSIDLETMEGLKRDFGKDDFMNAVERIRDYIAAGDVFQVNLAVRQSRPLISRPAHIYEWLRVLNPSPYMGYLRLPGFELVSASPELLVQLEGSTVRTRPIAGTRRRGASEEEDRRMRDELLANEKERAEHIMLVDLERNDLGRISRYGTVKVTELMGIEYYSHVMHIVSEVTGELAEGKDAYDVIAAAFPGGTITGAPKVRTMEIIEELEPVRRGPYTGSIGWIDYNGNMEFNIVIRTLLALEGQAYVQAGAGIVIDSVPEREYKESLSKAKALWKAVEYSEQHRLWDEEQMKKEADNQ